MAKLEKGLVESYKFYLEKGDEIIIKKGKPYIHVDMSGSHAFFTIDQYHCILSLNCDWGEFTYRGFPGKTETFKDLIMRLSPGYLLNKLSSETETNWKKSKRKANRHIA
jgi:hypothetical protein